MAKFHTSFCMQFIVESSDDSIDDSAGMGSISLEMPSKIHEVLPILPWKRLDFDVMLLLFRLVLLLLLIVPLLLSSCCSEVGFD